MSRVTDKQHYLEDKLRIAKMKNADKLYCSLKSIYTTYLVCCFKLCMLNNFMMYVSLLYTTIVMCICFGCLDYETDYKIIHAKSRFGHSYYFRSKTEEFLYCKYSAVLSKRIKQKLIIAGSYVGYFILYYLFINIM